MNNAGKGITGTVSGGTGTGYAITNASNILIKLVADSGRTFYLWIASVGMVGANITFNLSTPAPSGGVVTIADFPTSVTLTDSGGNTPQGQTNLSVTNTSTVTLTSFAIDDANVADVGWDTSSPASFQGHSYKGFNLTGQVVEFTYTGTDLWMPVYAYASTSCLTFTVDGGAPSTPTIQTDSQFMATPILSGASNTAHTIKVEFPAQFFVDVTHTFYGPGTVSYPTGYGKIHDLWKHPSYINRGQGIHRDGTLALLTAPGMDNQLRFATTGGSGGATHSYRLAVVACTGSAGLGKSYAAMRLDPNGDLKLYMLNQGGRYLLTTDNVEGTPSSDMPTDLAYTWQTVATGLDATALDETATTWPVRRKIAAAGDSIIAAWQSTVEATTLPGDVHRLGVAHDWDIQNLGQPGSNAPTTSPVATTDTEPDVILLAWGTNNVAGDPATITATWTTLLNDVRTVSPSALIVVRKILPRGAGGVDDVTTANNAIHTAITNIGDGNTLHIDASAGLVFPDDFTDSVLHPKYAGYTKIMANEVGALSGTDTTPPTVTLATAGPTLVMTPSEAITGVVLANFAMTGGHTLTGVSGSGAGPYTFTLTPPIAQGETVTGSFTAANTVFDTADVPNAMATFSGKAISNTSTLTVPDAPILTGVLAAANGITMDIEAGASDGGSAIIDYQIWHNRDGAGYVLFRTILAANIDNVAYTTDTGTLAGELVKIKVRCRNLLGFSDFCAETVNIESAGPPPVLRTSLSLGLGIGL